MNQIVTALQGSIPPLKNLTFSRVWLFVISVFVVLYSISPGQAKLTLEFTAGSFGEILPFLALAVGAVAFIKASGAETFIGRIFRGNLAVMILGAALFGALSPFCSCGVIPLIAALLAIGAPLSAVMAFWLSSPVMDPSMFLLTISVLGLPFAIGKTLAAISVGILGGATVHLFQQAGFLNDPLKEQIPSGCGATGLSVDDEMEWAIWRDQNRRATFGKEAVGNFLFLSKWLILAFMLESLMLAYVPADAVGNLVGGDGVSPIIISALVGVPAYLNGFAALPLVEGLIEQGMNPAAGMAFLVGGGVSCIPAAVAVYALVKKPVFVVYLAVAILGAILSGFGYAAFLNIFP